MFKGGFMIHKTWLASAFVGLSLALTACPGQTPTPTLEVSPTAKTVTAGGSAETFNATLKNSSETISWSFDPNLGTLSATTGESVKYTPPATIASTTTVTLTASAAGLKQNITIIVNPPPAVTLTVTPATKSIVAGATEAETFTATLTNATSDITWTLAPKLGTLSATTGASVQYTPPTTVKATTTITLTASAAGKQASASITVSTEPVVTLSVNPTTATTTAGGTNVTLNATLTNSSAAISWAIAPVSGSGSLSASSGSTVNYIPPATISSSIFATVTASAAGKTASTIIQVNPAPITVAGKVLKFDGTNANGVNVIVEDENGQKPVVTTDASGNFQVSKVVFPYSISALVPGANITFRPVTWTAVNRSDPQIVLPFNGVVTDWFSTCDRADGTLTGTISPPVPAGSTGYALFIAEGVSRNKVAFDTSSFSYVVATTTATTYALPVTFDKGLCKFNTTGSLIYIEKDASGAFTRARLLNNVTAVSGNTTQQDISSLPVNLISVSARLETPTGTQNASFYPAPRVNGLTVHCCAIDPVNPLLNGKVVQNGQTVTFDLPALPGLEYRMHIHGSFFFAQTGLYWSSATSTTSTVVLSLLNLIGPITPFGTLTGASPFTPTFSFNPVTGATIYQVHIYTNPNDPQTSAIWTGYTTSTSIKLPNLGTPARLTSGTYYWSVDAIALQGEPSIDRLLGGLMIRKDWSFSGSHYYADDVTGASYNYQGTQFIVP